MERKTISLKGMIGVFIGEYSHTIDTKGRLSMPARFRELLGEYFIATKGLDQSLFVYPLDEWKLLESKLKQLPLTNQNARAFVRFFFSGASECELDQQGRIRIPANLREHAELVKEVMVVGVGTRVEIWSQKNWASYNQDDNLSYDEIAGKMQELGI